MGENNSVPMRINGVEGQAGQGIVSQGPGVNEKWGGKLEWTLNKLLLGAGVGATPTEIDVPSGLTFTELAGTVSQVSPQDGSWADWDLSGTLPAGAVIVHLMVKATGSAACWGCRKNGSALLRITQSTNGSQIAIVDVECDANRVIEIYGLNATYYGTFYVWGYWS